MLADLDRLIAERGIGAIVVPMHELPHASFRWLSRGAKVTRGFAVRAAGKTILYHDPMERDEAAASGLAVRSLDDVGRSSIFATETRAGAAWARLIDAILADAGAPAGAVALAGAVPFPLYLRVAAELAQRGRALWEGEEDLIQLARKRKERWELDRIASVAARTEQVLDGLRAILRSARLEGGIAYRDDEPLTIGALKDFITAEIHRLGMIEDHETIVSQGRDAGVPHARGDRQAPLAASSPLVVDIFPADRASGYFIDITRTFCVGPVPADLASAHAEVLEALETTAAAMRAGEPASRYQALVCDYFEARGHRTTRSHPGTTAGYVHGLGHGVGLEVHERPSFALTPANRDLVEVGDVLTIEPGLYYPDRALGVRIEDTFWIGEDGRPVSFCAGSRALEP
ncbi:MAG TPA: M24 family metallopeptidase [Thermoanaerobaculia bacterium]|nr:M24 family metallopeptidase [Thermoanaerobaculia bacterium]